MQQFITKQYCPQLRLNFARIGLCQGREGDCFKCKSSPDNPLNWSAIKCTPNARLLKHMINSEICSTGLWLCLSKGFLKLFSGSLQNQFCPVYDSIKPYNTTPIMLKNMINQKPTGFDTISCVQKMILGQKIGCDTVKHPKLFQNTAQGTTGISNVKM